MMSLSIFPLMQEPEEEKSSDWWIVEDLYYELIREMPETTAKQMQKDGLLTHEQGETYTKLTKDKEKYLLDCLRKHKPGFLEKFCSVLHKVGAGELMNKISRHREGTTSYYYVTNDVN
jgi:hypothetical protein